MLPCRHMAEETIFSKIISGEIPSTKVYEDDTVLAFLDIQPVQPGHTLIIPKEPSADARETDPEVFAHLMKVAQNIANAQTTAFSCDGVNMIFNCGAAAGQEVFHTHCHVIPRYQDDGVFVPALRGEYEEDEALQIADAIKTAL
jgi:histidine triad (HIT) family protein